MMKRKGLIAGLLAMTVVLTVGKPGETATAYRVSPGTEPRDAAMKKWSTYNEKTKQHYMLRSYLEKLEAEGGGTLTLSKGTYILPMRMAIPSNTTIVLEDGVVLKKSMDTGGPATATTSVIELAPPSVVHGGKTVGGYDGSKNVTIIGKGNATIDLNRMKRASAFAVAHTDNLKISGITVKNQLGSHSIELDASRNAVIENMKFIDATAVPNTGPNEVINLDTPDPVTKGFPWKWSKQDRTPNVNVLIRNNLFKNVNAAIGTHQYSDGKPHQSIKIIGNTIDGTKDHAIWMTNWTKPTVTDNVIRNVRKADKKAIAILGRGVSSPIVQRNRIELADRAMQFQPIQLYGFRPVYNKMTDAEKLALRKNTVKGTAINQIVLFSKLNVYSTETSERFNFIL